MTEPRLLSSHHVTCANTRLTIEVLDAPGTNGASSTYLLTPRHERAVRLEFQRSPSAIGLTNEALAAVLIDRMEGLQYGPDEYARHDEALEHFKKGFEAMRPVDPDDEIRKATATWSGAEMVGVLADLSLAYCQIGEALEVLERIREKHPDSCVDEGLCRLADDALKRIYRYISGDPNTLSKGRIKAVLPVLGRVLGTIKGLHRCAAMGHAFDELHRAADLFQEVLRRRDSEQGLFRIDSGGET